MPNRCCFSDAVAWLSAFRQTGFEGTGASMTLEEKRDATRIEHMHDAIARIAVLMGTLEKEDFLAPI